MYEALVQKVHRRMAKAHDDLARCHDVYRLSHILLTLHDDLDILACEAQDMVREVEGEPVGLPADFCDGCGVECPKGECNASV